MLYQCKTILLFSRKILLLVALIVIAHVAKAQSQLAGVVLDARDSTALKGASVFINNGYKGTTTNSDGTFYINNISVDNFELVISFIGFETIVIKINKENIYKKFKVYLQPKQMEMQEVIVSIPEKNGWKDWGRVFTDYFIGTSKNAVECIIKNPEKLKFYFNKKTQVLRVISTDKLIIENKALGLIINYQLEEFSYNATTKVITFVGYSSFEKMESKRASKERNWVEKRREAYNGSLMHFIRTLYNNTTEKEGFTLRQLIRLYKTDSSARIYYDGILKGNSSYYDTAKFAVQLMKNSNSFSNDPIIYIIGKFPLKSDSIRVFDNASKKWYLIFNTDLQVVYNNEFQSDEYNFQNRITTKNKIKQQSIISLINGKAVSIEKNGLYYEPLDLFTEGYWGWEKTAEMLPIDYEPGE